MTDSGPLNELLVHLRGLRDNPKHDHLDVSLVGRSRFLLRKPDVQANHVVELAHLTLALLDTSREDLEPLVLLLLGAVELVSFDDLQRSIPVEVVTRGLSSPSQSVQSLGLSYLKKAAESPSGAAFVANDDALVEALVQLFLTSASAKIGATKALEAIISLLSVDDPDHITVISDGGVSGKTAGQGLFWRRLFHDEEIYKLFFQATSTEQSNHDRSRSEVTTAQGRLLDFILESAKIRWDAICDCAKLDRQTDSNTQRTVDVKGQSLLQYATLKMVDRDDALMANVLIGFLTKLLEVQNPAGCEGIASIPARSSPSLEFLVQSSLHQRAVDYYLQSEEESSLEVNILRGAHVRYICTYADLYPEHFCNDTDLATNTIARLNQNLQISGARWAHASSPVQDLNVLGHVPSVALVEALRSNENPLMLLPTNPANPYAYETLGKIFHGPGNDASGFEENLRADQDIFSRGSRAASARLLFYQYHDRHPEFWTNVGAAMNVLAMPKAVVAALNLVRSILTAVWTGLPETGSGGTEKSSLPPEEKLGELCGGKVSRTGVAEVFNAGESVIQSLLTPLKTVGGDVEASRLARRLGRVKFDLVLLISDMMKEGRGKSQVPVQRWQDIGRRIRERIRLEESGRISSQTNLVGTLGR